MEKETQKLIFDVSAYEEEKKRLTAEYQDRLHFRDQVITRHENAKRAGYRYFIAALAALLLTGILDFIIRGTSEGVVMPLTVLKCGLLVVILWSAFILNVKVPDIVALKVDDTWYRYESIIAKYNEEIAALEADIRKTDEVIQKVEALRPKSTETDALWEAHVQEENSSIGKMPDDLKQDEDGGYRIDLEDVWKSLEEESDGV